jgi:RES domain-containing protein
VAGSKTSPKHDDVEGVPVVRSAFERTIRLVSTARLREAVLKVLADDEGELADLAEIESATSTRLLSENNRLSGGAQGLTAEDLVHGVAHASFINAAFSYTKPRELNRFNGADRGAWYAALDVETCLREIVFHMTEFLARTGEFRAKVQYSELHASLAGEYLDLRSMPDHPSLSIDRVLGYQAGNALARAAIANDINGIIYPSVRHPGGTCFVALWPHAVQSAAQGAIHVVEWTGEPVPRISRVEG